MLNIPCQFQPHINTDYPKNNKKIFEEWLFENIKEDVSDREYLSVFWTSIWVNNNYAQDLSKVREVQNYVDSLDRNLKYWTCVQYDDTCVIDFKDLDVFVFGMAKRLDEQKIDYLIPLMGEKNPYTFNNMKDYFVSFVGGITHPIRKKMLEVMKDFPESYISTNDHDAYRYCEIISKSNFVLCPRGYSCTSFRITESLEFGAVPIFISDKFLVPHGLDFNEYGLMVHENDLERLPEILSELKYAYWVEKTFKGQEIYKNYYTYKANLNLIKKHLQTIK